MFAKGIHMLILTMLLMCGQTATEEQGMSDTSAAGLEKATFGGGCFWCVEAMFQDINGVTGVVSGYSGGQVKDPTYKEVCSDRTGHAEVIQVTYDPELISYGILLDAFWLSHDPTQLNRQGADIGTQYRSVIFYHNATQEMLAREYRKRLNDTDAYGAPVVTEISAMDVFYPAEDYHQDYYSANPNQPYCSRVVAPKLEKFRETFREVIGE